MLARFTIAYELLGSAADAGDVLQRPAMADMAVEVGTYNAVPALLLRTADGRLDTVELIETSGDRVTGLYAIRNPDKLGTAEPTRALER
ncbi:hypothetical protein [Nocardia sp. NPDC059228]|uniref:hypothetical protein n=1 Tax=Nocardia sp. NPDC059228 TaxID=3346777 RepID=UPI0036835F81